MHVTKALYQVFSLIHSEFHLNNTTIIFKKVLKK